MIVKTISARGSKGHHDFTLSVQEDSTQNNSSFISYTFKISATNSSWQWRSYNNITYTISINGTNYTGTIPNFNGSTTTLKTGSNIEIPHDSDGTKTIPVEFSVTDPNTGVSYTCGNASASDTMELTTLHTPPEIIEWSVVEQNALIGSSYGSGKIINHLSIKKDKIRATTYDGATLSKFRVYNGTQLLNEVTSSTSPTEITTDFANVDLQTTTSGHANITIEVEDSKGGIGRTSWNYNVFDYKLPNIVTTSSNIKRNGQSTGQVNLNLVATYTSGTIGLTTNDVTLQFAYWVKGQTESTTYYTIPSSAYTISGDDITISSWTMYKNSTLIEDVSPSSAYYFRIKITDTFNKTSEVQLLCASGEYIMCKFNNRVDFKKITQKNIDVLTEGVIAYEDSDGTNGDVILGYSSVDYNHCIIFFRTNDSDTPESSVRIDNPNGKTAMLMGIQPYTSSSCYIKSKKVAISGTSITNVNYSQVQLRSNNYPTVSNDNNVYITKVIFF